MPDLELMSTWAFCQGHGQTPLLRGRRDPNLEIHSQISLVPLLRGPLVFCILLESVKARLEMMHLQCLHEYIRMLKLRRSLVQQYKRMWPLWTA